MNFLNKKVIALSFGFSVIFSPLAFSCGNTISNELKMACELNKSDLIAKEIEDNITIKECNIKSNCNKTGLYLTAKEAFNIKNKYNKDVAFIDIRTFYEFAFVGYPIGIDKAIEFQVLSNPLTWIEKKGFKRSISPNFINNLDNVMNQLGYTKDTPIIFICRSGDRSAKAVDMARDAGYKHAYSVYDGFEGE